MFVHGDRGCRREPSPGSLLVRSGSFMFDLHDPSLNKQQHGALIRITWSPPRHNEERFVADWETPPEPDIALTLADHQNHRDVYISASALSSSIYVYIYTRYMFCLKGIFLFIVCIIMYYFRIIVIIV